MSNMFFAGHNEGYVKALVDVRELLRNARENSDGPGAVQHWDHELEDQLIMLAAQEGVELPE